ncbi:MULTISPECIES: TetR/AcrR family transcriptional regulator [Shewanella]|uniref:TetR/AcrR family transcriptional regulator n=1 Tax=Shewanella insulae TaxID=2681496 RepID=A0A6L7HYB2_9GAMM|nr:MULTISPECIES: TetR-like C-terminal domain-containing protein [Shewanella]MCG9748649.1 WHG domain-containing protein [Shewanella sp. Isolate8]MCL2910916.1 WHG domain-containing protein [Shewanella aquimarina]MXR69010.1 TetR/AcrR family transcriptional regulator [Shewanella insulae]
MARRKEHTHDEIRAMATAAVLQHLAVESLDSLSLRKVAQVVGYVPSTLVNLFGSYQGLLLAVAELTLDQLYQCLVSNAQVSQAYDSNPLEAMANAYQQFAFEQPRAFQLIFELKATDEQGLSEHHARLIAQLFALIESCLGELLPELSGEQRLLASRALWGGVHGLVCLALDDKLFAPGISIEEAIRHHIAVQLKGLGYHKEALCC